MTHTPGPITHLLARVSAGDSNAMDHLFPIVYQQLRQAAEGVLRSERPGHTLQPTALVHEAYLRLVRDETARWENRAHFFGAAAG